MRRTAFSGIGHHAAMVCTVLSVFCLWGLAGAAGAQQSIRFEAEDVTGPADAWQTDRYSDDKWNLWSTDKDAAKKWSGGVVLQSPRVLQDREKPEDGAPPLHTRIESEKIPPGKYYVEIGGVGRPLAISLDGKDWKKIEGSARNLGLVEVGQEGFQLWVDDRYASGTNPGSAYYDYLEFTPLPDPNRKPKVQGFAETRVEEPLGRGLVALPLDGGRIYLGWRLLKEDPQNIAFDVYRRTAGSASQKLNQAPLSQTTDFVDEQPRGRTCETNTSWCRPRAATRASRPRCRSRAVRAGAELPELPTERRPQLSEMRHRRSQRRRRLRLRDQTARRQYRSVRELLAAQSRDLQDRSLPGRRHVLVALRPGLGDRTGNLVFAHGRVRPGWRWPGGSLPEGRRGRSPRQRRTRAIRTGIPPGARRPERPGKSPRRLAPREAFPSYNYASRNQLAVAFLDGKTPA